MQPKLSICCITYNHAKFIRQALDSFLMQKTNFPFEVIVHDDASTDGTADIIREYAEKYPDIIKPIFQTENQWSKGIDCCKNFVFPRVKGKYVALCEGDDYWTDEYKLQKQVDFLDSHPEYSICFNRVNILWEDSNEIGEVFPKLDIFTKTVFDIQDFKYENWIPTNSVVYRWCLRGCENLIPDNILPGDKYIHLLHLLKGKAYLMPEVMGIYRKHSGGIWFNHDDNFYLLYWKALLNFYICAEKQFGFDYFEQKKELMGKFIIAGCRLGNWNFLQNLKNLYPMLFVDSLRNARICGSVNAEFDVVKMLEKTREQSKRFQHLYNLFFIVCLLEILLIFVLVVWRNFL